MSPSLQLLIDWSELSKSVMPFSVRYAVGALECDDLTDFYFRDDHPGQIAPIVNEVFPGSEQYTDFLNRTILWSSAVDIDHNESTSLPRKPKQRLRVGRELFARNEYVSTRDLSLFPGIHLKSIVWVTDDLSKTTPMSQAPIRSWNKIHLGAKNTNSLTTCMLTWIYSERSKTRNIANASTITGNPNMKTIFHLFQGRFWCHRVSRSKLIEPNSTLSSMQWSVWISQYSLLTETSDSSCSLSSRILCWRCTLGL